ncbi:hypothetical protein ILP92_14825 [Maribius pontilimi]|uniref:Uncharacterized protein n=1 Tax=Palleronia pontilimi TaxID=1964209 RepID=A0A934IJD6_9RHOB|nr:hypothetical protein [Palleronia pontilimi]MBJ3764021.1 hypothetical protein [Palleronia pontilimi]
MRAKVALLIAALALSACVNTTAQTGADPILSRALSTQPDGYRGVLPQTGQRFTIVSSLASETRLCRVVSIGRSAESYCKTRGGPWR